MRHALPFVLVCACASHFKTEVVGGGAAVIRARGAANSEASSGVQLARGQYDFALHFDLTRAQVVEYTVACPGVEQHGSIGETFEAYRQRRLAQLRAQREQDRKNAAAATSLVVG